MATPVIPLATILTNIMNAVVTIINEAARVIYDNAATIAHIFIIGAIIGAIFLVFRRIPIFAWLRRVLPF